MLVVDHRLIIGFILIDSLFLHTHPQIAGEIAGVSDALWRSWQVQNDVTHESRSFSINGYVRFLRSYWTELCNISQNRDMADP